MRTLTKIFLLFSMVFLAICCVNNHKNIASKEKAQLNCKAINVVGIYSGNLPCVDCEFISTLLELNQDKSYTLRSIYEGKSDDQFVIEGKWSIEKNKLNLQGLDFQYKINADHLTQLDLSGNEIKGYLADKYQLLRVE